MKIQPLNIIFFKNQTSTPKRKSISFGEIPIYQINLKQKNKDGQYSFIPACFSKINNKDKEDIVLMEKIGNYWSRKPRETSYGITVSNNFLWAACDNNFYIIEKSDKSKNTYRKTTCIMETTPVDSEDKSMFRIFLLQSHPEIARKQHPKIKGSGELALYGGVKEAKEHGFESVQLLSANNSFYEHMGFTPMEKYRQNWYELPSSEFDKFLERIEKKYGMKKE